MCGVVGVLGHPNAAPQTFQGLLMLQHRGQDSAGILSFNPESNEFHLIKQKGHVKDIFGEEQLRELEGTMAIGHTRYSTMGTSAHKDIQPFTTNYPMGLGLAHNGNVINCAELKQELESDYGRHIFSNNDAEILLNLFSIGLGQYQDNWRSLSGKELFEHVERATSFVISKAKGAFSVIGMLAGAGMFAFRDQFGIRPLAYGKNIQDGQSFCFASETNVFHFLGFEPLGEVGNGELVFIDKERTLHSKTVMQSVPRPCMFEYVYFSNPDSRFEQGPIYRARLRLGEQLAKRWKDKQINNVDCIVPIPETSRIAAIAMSEQTGIPYRELLIKNRYIQRSFILGQAGRGKAMNLKLMPIREEIEGKSLVLVDDSIVRGTTSRRLVELLKECKPREIHLAISCPPIKYPCYYGIDFPEEEELVANSRQSEEEIASSLGVSSVTYLSIDGLKEALKRKSLCTACLDGNYPQSPADPEAYRSTRRKHRAAR